jgi:hypothetical protein
MALMEGRCTADRIAALLDLLAGRFGARVPGGVVLRVPLTHALLAEPVGAHRPAVTVASRQLVEAGRLRRDASRFWMLPDGAR